MNASKLQLKLFARTDMGGDLPLETFIPVLHRWIKEHLLPEMSIDVAELTLEMVAPCGIPGPEMVRP